MSEQREEYTTGAEQADGVVDWAGLVNHYISTGTEPPFHNLSKRADLDIAIKRAGGTSLHISHYKSGDSLTATEQGVFVGALWLSWAEVMEIRQAVQ